MYVLIVKIQVKPEHLAAFIPAMNENAHHSLHDEPGCVRFDVVQDNADPSHLLLYEIYHDRAAFEAHLKTPHFLKWRDLVKDWHAAPLQSWHGANLYPPDDKIG